MMFETVLSTLFAQLKTASNVAIVSYDGLVIAKYPEKNPAGDAHVSAMTPLIQQMKTGFKQMELGKVTGLVLEGPNVKTFYCPINERYLLTTTVDSDEYNGRISFELSSAATSILGYF